MSTVEVAAPPTRHAGRSRVGRLRGSIPAVASAPAPTSSTPWVPLHGHGHPMVKGEAFWGDPEEDPTLSPVT